MILKPYFSEPGPSLERHRGDLELLRDRAREILPDLERTEGRSGRPPYNPTDFSFNSLEARSSEQAVQAGQRIALAISDVLGWSVVHRPEFLAHLNWNFFYVSVPGSKAEPGSTEDLHADSLQERRGFGLWVPDPGLASFRLLVPRDETSRVFCKESEDESPQALLDLGQVKLLSFSGNCVFHLPAGAYHDRAPIDFSAQPEQPQERFALRAWVS
jgi:hypothetical protein